MKPNQKQSWFNWIKNRQFILLLTALVILAALLRLPFLETFPPAMLQDEVAIGYNAISIAETGRDEWGETYPLLNFKSFGDHKMPVFIYATALLYKLVGWQAVLPRFISAIAGTLIVLFLALFGCAAGWPQITWLCLPDCCWQLAPGQST